MKIPDFVRRRLPICLLLAAALLGGCAAPTGQMQMPSSMRETSSLGRAGFADSMNAGARDATARPRPSAAMAPPAPAERPGLATGWGRTKQSHVSPTEFEREPGSQRTAQIHYNDREGAEAMRDAAGRPYRTSLGCYTFDNRVEVGLETPRGRSLPYIRAHGRTIYLGDRGDAYVVAIRNRTAERIEVVVSVDGLDVIDGRSASTTKRGYIIDPRKKLRIEGFRRSGSQVAAFEFSSVGGSYANLRHGAAATRNVGVIGVASFQEHNPEVYQRQTADPFPGGYATPPR